MATTKKAKKKAKKTIKNGIHLKRSKDGKQFGWNITNRGRVLSDSGEQYHNLHDMQDGMKTVYLMLKDYYDNGNLKIFHDETGDVK